MDWPKVSTILLNWNGYDVSKACIDSLLPITYPRHEIVLIDNASADGSGTRLHAEFPGLDYVQNDRNLGFARGCNVGIRRAMKAGADFVLLLNNDVVVEPGFLEPLVALARKDESIGLVSGKMHLMGTDNLLWYAGAQISRIRGNVVVDGFRQADDGRFDQTREVGACTGAMMLIRRRVLETVGLLPEEYFFGQEEWDYSITVHKAGFRLYYCAESLVHHRADGSHGNTSPKIIYCGMRNRLIFQNKFLPQRVFKVWLAAYSFYVQHIAGKRLRLLGDDLRAYKLAHSAAVRDHRKHGRLYVDEEDLLNFEREFVLSKLA